MLSVKDFRSVPRLKLPGMTIDIHQNSSWLEGCLDDISCFGLKVASLPTESIQPEKSYTCVISGYQFTFELNIQPVWIKSNPQHDSQEAGFEIVEPLLEWKQLFISFLVEYQKKTLSSEMESIGSDAGKVRPEQTSCPRSDELQKILIVEDETVIATMLQTLLKGFCGVDIASDGQQALDLLESKPYDLIVSDYALPLMNGIDLFRKAVSQCPALKDKFLFISGSLPDYLIKFLVDNSIKYFIKPFDITEFRKETYERVYCLKAVN